MSPTPPIPAPEETLYARRVQPAAQDGPARGPTRPYGTMRRLRPFAFAHQPSLGRVYPTCGPRRLLLPFLPLRTGL